MGAGTVDVHPLPRQSAEAPRPEAESLRVSVTYRDDRAAVYAAGGLDGPGGETLSSVVTQLVRARLRRVELDLSRVTFADLSGVRALDEFRTALADVGTEVRISSANPNDHPPRSWT